MEPTTVYLERIINKSIEVYSKSTDIWKIFFLPFFILMLMSLVLVIFPYTSIFAGASFLRFDLYPEMDFIIFAGFLLALVCVFSYCAVVVMAITKNYITSGKIQFTLNNFEGKLISVTSS